jgi:hypothetical protein
MVKIPKVNILNQPQSPVPKFIVGYSGFPVKDFERLCNVFNNYIIIRVVTPRMVPCDYSWRFLLYLKWFIKLGGLKNE